MQGFIHILKLNDSPTLDNDIESLLKKYKSKNLHVHEVSNTKMTSVYFTNEHDEYPYFFSEDGLFTPVGVFTKNLKEVYQNITVSNNNKKIDYVKNLEGQFAIGNSDFLNNEISLFTHIARIETLYSYISENIIIVGTDPLIIGLIAYNGNIEFDVQSMYSFIQNGYYSDDLTPFKNVTALPANSYILINKTGLKSYDIDDLNSNLLNLDYSKNDYDNLTDTFLNAFNTQNNEKDFKLALTGGKDSRLIFAAMNSNHFNLSVFTNGFENNPDVVIAKKIADMYNVEHKVTSPKISKENTIDVNIYQKIKSVMMSTSGLVYGYENVSGLGKFNGHKSFDGVGAELVKGGFSAFIYSDANSNKDNLIKIFNKNHQYFKPENENTFRNFLYDFIDNEHGLHKLQILYSLKYRSGRLTSAAKNASNYSRQSHSPFLDNKFLRESLKINYLENKNEEIHYQILKRLDDRLIDVPFGRDRWRVERSKPMTPADYNKWFHRQPFYPNTVLGNYNWRNLQNNDKTIINQFKNILLSNPNHMIYEIIDYRKVENLFSQPIKAGYMRFIWSLASVIIFVNELKEHDNRVFNKNLSITLPSTSVKEFKSKKRIIDISDDFVPLNKSLSKVEVDNTFKVVNHKHNRILKLFKGKFADAPEEVNLKNTKKISIRLHLTLLNEIEDVKFQIIYYNNNKRVEHFFAQKLVSGNDIEFYHELDTGKHDSFRGLIYFTKAKINNQFKLNYSFYELTY